MAFFKETVNFLETGQHVIELGAVVTGFIVQSLQRCGRRSASEIRPSSDVTLDDRVLCAPVRDTAPHCVPGTHKPGYFAIIIIEHRVRNIQQRAKDVNM